VKDIRTIAKFLGVFGAGAVTAGFFLSGPVDYPTQHDPPTTTVNGGWALVPPTTPLTWTGETFARPMPEPPQQSPSPATDRPNVETTGSSTAQGASAIPNSGRIEMTPRGDAACNVSVCRSFYRSFDEATCTYRPYGGGPPRLCNR
jgi:hypothetical protein